MDGEQIVMPDQTFAFDGANSLWLDESLNGANPCLDVSQVACFYLGRVSEPTAFSLFGLGSVMVLLGRRRG